MSSDLLTQLKSLDPNNFPDHFPNRFTRWSQQKDLTQAEWELISKGPMNQIMLLSNYSIESNEIGHVLDGCTMSGWGSYTSTINGNGTWWFIPVIYYKKGQVP
jgi:hypothetical protein